MSNRHDVESTGLVYVSAYHGEWRNDMRKCLNPVLLDCVNCQEGLYIDCFDDLSSETPPTPWGIGGNGAHNPSADTFA